MNVDRIMIHFGELTTKGKNQKDFIRTLGKNIKHALKDFSDLKLDVRYDHIYVVLNGEDVDEVSERLKNVSGIYSISLVYSCEKSLDAIKNTSLEIIKEEKGNTFKVKSKRGDKSFPFISDEIVRHVAGNILANTNLKVDVHNPDILINIDVRDEAVYLFTKTIKCSGGYPLGTCGKVMMMLSGGIDSPVASYLLIKRGIKIECIHYASPPYTQIGVIEKLKDLLSVLNTYQADIKLNIIPFTKIQEKIYEVCDESYAITIMRRMMYRLASRLAERNNILAIANGESLCQVASQTIESVNVINNVTNMPVIRPVATIDKLDIIDIAKKIGTYEISIRPYEDCCTIFAPRKPKTKPTLKECEFLEAKYDFEPLLSEALDNVEVIYINDHEE